MPQVVSETVPKYFLFTNVPQWDMKAAKNYSLGPAQTVSHYSWQRWWWRMKVKIKALDHQINKDGIQV